MKKCTECGETIYFACCPCFLERSHVGKKIEQDTPTKEELEKEICWQMAKYFPAGTHVMECSNLAEKIILMFKRSK